MSMDQEMLITLNGQGFDTYHDFFQFGPTLHPKIRQQLHKSARSFREFLVRDRDFILAPFHEEIISVLSDHSIKMVCIRAPRESGKSTLSCESLAAHHLLFYPGSYVVIFSNSATQAKKRGRAIKNLIKKHSVYTHLSQTGISLWGEEFFELKNSSRCEVYGVGAAVAGIKHLELRPSLIILDDVILPLAKSTLSDSGLELWFDESILNLGGSYTRIILVGTPYRQTDLLNRTASNPEFKFLSYESLLGKDLNALFNDDTETLWPAHWPIERLRKKYLALQRNDLVFSRQYLCRIVAPDSMLFHPNLIKAAKNEKLVFYPKRPTDQDLVDYPEVFPIEYEYYVAGVDLSTGLNRNADWVTIQVLGITDKGRIDTIWLERHHLLYKQLKLLMASLHQRFLFDDVCIEDNVFQVVFSQELEEDTIIPVRRHTTSRNKMDEQIGLPRVANHMQNQRIRFPCKPDQSYTQSTFTEVIDDHGNRDWIVNHTGGSFIAANQEIMFSELQGWVSDGEKWISVTKNDDTSISFWKAIISAEALGAGIYDLGNFDEYLKKEGEEKEEEYPGYLKW